MALKMSNVLTSYVIIGLLASLMVSLYGGFLEVYDFTKGATDGSGDNIADKINQLNLIEGQNAFMTSVYKVVNPGNPIDLIGGFLGAGLGILQTATGVITTPVEIMTITMGYYFIPPAVFTAIGTIIIIYVGFILLNAYIGKDN